MDSTHIVNCLYWPAALALRNPRRYYAPHSRSWTSYNMPPRHRGPSLCTAKRLRFIPVFRPIVDLPF